MKTDLRKGDCLQEIKRIPDESVDAIVTDSPYELGFMGKKWDASGIAYNVELWKECLRVLKPGGHLVSFGGTRTYHRMAVAIEDAGFEIRDMLEWIYASGFPKSQNVGKKYDQLRGNEREEYLENIAFSDSDCWGVPNKNSKGTKGMFLDAGKVTGAGKVKRTKGNSQWEGFGSNLKPAHEPIVLARRPLSEKTIVENCIKHGTGALDIDGCRIPTSENDKQEMQKKRDSFKNTNDGFQNKYVGGKAKDFKNELSQGRFPANLLVTDDALNDGEITKSGKDKTDNPTMSTSGFTGHGIRGKHCNHGDSGSKSRFFDIDVWAEKHGLIQVPKASKKERNAGMSGKRFGGLEIILYLCKESKDIKLWNEKITIQEGKEVKHLMDMDISLKKVIEEYGIKMKKDLDLNIISFGSKILAKYLKHTKFITKMEISSTTAQQTLNLLHPFIIKESTQDVNLEKMDGGSLVKNVVSLNTLTITINEKMGLVHGASPVALKMQLKINEKENANEHATVKPLNVLSWLIRLISKEGDIVLDPFMGSGTTGISCVGLNRSFIGIEKEGDSFEIAKKRIEAKKKEPKQKTLF